jgi:4-diphosphocytidyl-2-C-methyl-D-erythritol kinase
MISFPNCKINLGLKVLRKRADGYHDLSTVFYPIPLKDVLEVIQSPAPAFTAYGLPIPGGGDSGDIGDGSGSGDIGGGRKLNICEQAWQLLKADFADLPNVHIHLYKQIPIGAGLGGGSADGAFTLLALNRQFQLGLDTPALLDYAAKLGSDCPFFILNTPCLGGGRGERLEPIPLDLSAYGIALVDPGIHISTARAFAVCTPRETGSSLRETGSSLRDIIQAPVSSWVDDLHNDFEEPLFQLHPSLRRIKEILYAQGAVYASLTGSGSSFYGLFPKEDTPASLPLSENYRILP